MHQETVAQEKRELALSLMIEEIDYVKDGKILRLVLELTSSMETASVGDFELKRGSSSRSSRDAPGSL